MAHAIHISLRPALQVLFAAELFYAPAIAAAKISTLLLFARIFPARNFRRVLWAIGIFVLMYTAIVMIVGIFQCRPIEGAWNPTIGAHCIDIKSAWMTISSMNVLTDVAIIIAPIPQLWNLQIRRNTKIELIGIFSIGGLFVTLSSDRSVVGTLLTWC